MWGIRLAFAGRLRNTSAKGARGTIMLKRATEKRIFDFDKRAVAFWMEVEGTVPASFVRVFVTHEVLSDIDPNGPHDLDGDLSTFDKNRDRIELAANSKFHRGETEDWLHEGQPAVVLVDSDL
jgi:hypothetical protein